MAKKIPLNPKHPERICWGCDKYCAADSLGCGNGSGRTQHPAELLGEDWYTYGDWDIEGPLTVADPSAAMASTASSETGAELGAPPALASDRSPHSTSDHISDATTAPAVIWLHAH